MKMIDWIRAQLDSSNLITVHSRDDDGPIGDPIAVGPQFRSPGALDALVETLTERARDHKGDEPPNVLRTYYVASGSLRMEFMV